MGAQTSYIISDSSLTASFRAWGSVVDATFVTFGWVRTSDTGQVNWSTVTGPGVANTSCGYSIFRMADTLQGSYPVFIKIEYGSNGAGANCACIWITVGTGSDGAGNITGALTGRYQLYDANAETTANMPSYFSGSTNRYCFVLWPQNNQAYNYMLFSIERTKNASGAVTGDGLLFFIGYFAGCASQYIPFAGTAPPGYSAWNCNIPASVIPTTYGAYKNTVAVYPIRCWTPGESGPSSNIFMFQKPDITMSVTNTIQLTLFDGAVTGTYLPPIYFSTGNTFAITTTNRGMSGGGNVSLLMRYE